MPPVLLDIGPAVHQNAGLARYTERLAVHLLAQAHTPLACFYNAHSGDLPPASLAASPTYTLPLGQYAWRLSVLASQVARIPYQPLTRILTRVQAAAGSTGGPCIYHAAEHLLPYLPGPTVLTVHDLIFERYPQHHTRLNTLFLRTGMPLFVRSATAIIAVSQHTVHDLVELYGVAPGKIHIIYEGIDARFAPATPDRVATVRARYSSDRPYLLMVGTLEPRKNHVTALHALARLKAAGHPHRLLVVGGKGWLFEPVQALVEELGLSPDVVFCGYVPDVDLPPLYTGAACVLAPSLYEGFGFPVLEAMACAAPVVCSNVSSLPEVAGDAALLIAPEDDEALANAVALVLTQPALAAAMRDRGLTNARQFQWETCAAQTAALYVELAERAAPTLRRQ